MIMGERKGLHIQKIWMIRNGLCILVLYQFGKYDLFQLSGAPKKDLIF